MVLLEATLLEVLRLRSVVPLAIPHKTLCDTSVGGFHIPARTMVTIHIIATLTIEVLIATVMFESFFLMTCLFAMLLAVEGGFLTKYSGKLH